jgi:hypothetical protein
MEPDSALRDRIDVGSSSGSSTAVAEKLPLIDSNIVHYDQDDIRRRRFGRHSRTTATPTPSQNKQHHQAGPSNPPIPIVPNEIS